MLKRLESKGVTRRGDGSYDAYVGEYEVTPSFTVKIFKEGDKLMTQATNQPAFELFPDGENSFLQRGKCESRFCEGRCGHCYRSCDPSGRPRRSGQEDQISTRKSR